MTTKTTTQEPRKDTAPATDTPTPPPAATKQVIGRFVEPRASNGPSAKLAAKLPVALFCHEAPDTFLGKQAAQLAATLAKRGQRVHLFTRQPYELSEANIEVHAVGTSDEADPVAQSKEFVRRASNAFMTAVPAGQSASVLAFEWSAGGVLPLLRGLRNQHGVLSLYSLERQRSDLSSEVSRQINEIEREALESAQSVLVHDAGTAEQARLWLPACADKLIGTREPFPIANFESELDPGEIKARYQVGPVDPVILFVGDLDERYGPDLILKAMPALLRHHPQARLVIVGDGNMQWPLRVYARYLLLEYAVRIVGHVADQPLAELIQAADVVCVPSRESTPWWPILAGWAAKRPVVATHDAARSLLDHEKDAVLVYPSENSVVWGVERVLYDADLRKAMGEAGRKKLEERFGWDGAAEQVEEVLAAR